MATHTQGGAKSGSGRALIVGTDCSGIDAPIWALERLRVPYKYAFGSDIDPNSHKVIGMQRHKRMHPQTMYTDMTARDHSALPHLDVYVSGFPCQPFSNYGRRKGHDDPRAKVMDHVIRTIRATRPKIFVLENVATLANQELLFEPVRAALCEFDAEYEIHISTIQSEDFGIPHRRNRMYILGLLRSEKKPCHIARWPPQRRRTYRTPNIEKVLLPDDSPLVPPEAFVRPQNETFAKIHAKIREAGGDPDAEPWIFATRTSHDFSHAIFGISPTLTASHASHMWVTSRRRYLVPRELCRLQGFPDSFVHHPSRSVCGKQLGNSMSVHVVAAILETALASIGYPVPTRRRR